MFKIRNYKLKIRNYFIFCFAFLVFSFNFSFAIDFTHPNSTAPNNNLTPPVNVGVLPQVKSGGLVLGAGGPQVGLNVLGGNVGIGIGASAPATKLEVGGTITSTDFCLKNGSWCASIQGGAGGGGVSGGTANYITRWAGASTLDLSLIYDNGTNIGIGTTNPTGLLHLNDNSVTPTARPMLNITRPNSQGIPGQDSSNAGLYILTRDYPLNVDVYDTGAVGGYRPAFTIDGNGDTTIRGNVLVDNPDPAGTLFDVDGTVKANNIFLGIGGWSIFDGGAGLLKIGTGGGDTGGLDIFNLNVSNPAGTATFAKDITAGGNITATSFCFSGGGNCLTPANTGVSSVTSSDSYIDVAPPAGTGDVQLSLGITPLVNYLDDIFQLQANNPDPANPNSYVCPVGEALVEIDALGGFICEPIGGGGSVGPGTVGSLPKFVTANQVGDSGVFEDAGTENISVGTANPLAKLDVSSLGNGVKGRSAIGVFGKSSSAGFTGILGEDSGIGTGGYGVTGLSTNTNGTGVYGQASNTGGTGGLFRFTGTPGQGHALKTTNGPVYLDQTVGIGYDPLSVSWPSVTPPNSTSQPMKLRVGGPVGARLYCDEDGTGCIEIGPTSLLYCSGDGTNCVDLSNATTNYWTLVPGTEAIYNNNRGANGTVGIGVDPLNLSSFEKFNVLTNDGENIAIKGETSTNGGIGVYGSAGAGSTNAYGVVGKANGTGGAGGYFSYNGVGNGYSLVADFGLVQLGHFPPPDNGVVGVGIAPANWITSGGRKSIQLAVRGNVGAAYYCDEDGYDCAYGKKSKLEYWKINSTTGDLLPNFFPTDPIQENNLQPDDYKIGIGTNAVSYYYDEDTLTTRPYNLDIRTVPGRADGGLWPEQVCIRHEGVWNFFRDNPGASNYPYYYYPKRSRSAWSNQASTTRNATVLQYDYGGNPVNVPGYEVFQSIGSPTDLYTYTYYLGITSASPPRPGLIGETFNVPGGGQVYSYYDPNDAIPEWECAGSWQEFRYIITSSPRNGN